MNSLCTFFIILQYNKGSIWLWWLNPIPSYPLLLHIPSQLECHFLSFSFAATTCIPYVTLPRYRYGERHWVLNNIKTVCTYTVRHLYRSTQKYYMLIFATTCTVHSVSHQMVKFTSVNTLRTRWGGSGGTFFTTEVGQNPSQFFKSRQPDPIPCGMKSLSLSMFWGI